MATPIPIAGTIFFIYILFKKSKIVFVVRSSSGISVALGPPHYKSLPEFNAVESKSCRTMLFSPDGKYFAFVSGQM